MRCRARPSSEVGLKASTVPRGTGTLEQLTRRICFDMNAIRRLKLAVVREAFCQISKNKNRSREHETPS